MKNNIEWHRQCLANGIAYARATKERALGDLKRADADLADCEFRRKQIEQAEKEGLTEFDAAKFLINRKRK